MIRALYITIELTFYLIFRLVLKPRANDLSKKKRHPFRDYAHILDEPDSHRSRLFKRILDRIKVTSANQGTCFHADFDAFIRGWFSFTRREHSATGTFIDTHTATLNDDITDFGNEIESSAQEGDSSTHSLTSEQSLSSNSGEDTNDNHSLPRKYCKANLPIIDFENVEKFFAWAFFDKRFDDLQSWECSEIDEMMELLRVEHDITFPKKYDVRDRDWNVQPRCMTLERSNALHRPLALYIFFGFVRLLGYAVLYIIFGYRRYEIIYEKGRTFSYWYRDGNAKGHEGTFKNPFLFFHGIAPGGLTFYLPFLEYCFPSKQSAESTRPVFLFETLPIACHLSFDVLSEEETVFGVEQALKRHGFSNNNCKLTLCGHSFGSFQLTWMVKAKRLRPLIEKLIILDSVSVLLSSPEVVSNFVYNGGEEKSGSDWATYLNKTMIHLMASSELFTEHYLRRGFAWYNSELWIEDIPKQVETHVFLAEKDVILDSQKIKKELQMHCRSRKNLSYTIWKGYGHADVLTRPHLWPDVLAALNYREKMD